MQTDWPARGGEIGPNRWNKRNSVNSLRSSPEILSEHSCWNVTGQDSIQPVTYRDELHWFWGDTNQLQYPLGLFRKTDDGVDYFYFGNPFPVTRVPATLAGIQDRNAYESWTCREELSEEYFTESQLSAAKPRRDSSGQLVWAWRKAPPVTQQDELRWLKQGLIQIEEARYLPRDVDADGTSLRSK